MSVSDEKPWKSGAKITKFSINPKLDLVKGPNDCSFFVGTIMVPGQSIQMLVIDTEHNMNSITHSVCIEYENMTGTKKYSETYTLVQQYAGEAGSITVTRSNPSKPQSAIIDIAHSLDTIKNSML